MITFEPLHVRKKPLYTHYIYNLQFVDIGNYTIVFKTYITDNLHLQFYNFTITDSTRSNQATGLTFPVPRKAAEREIEKRKERERRKAGPVPVSHLGAVN